MKLYKGTAIDNARKAERQAFLEQEASQRTINDAALIATGVMMLLVAQKLFFFSGWWK